MGNMNSNDWLFPNWFLLEQGITDYLTPPIIPHAVQDGQAIALCINSMTTACEHNSHHVSY